MAEDDRGDMWSKLLPELLHLIYRNLSDTGDFVRFRAVCTAWREAAPVSDPPPQLPWILERRRASSSDTLVRPQVRFYSHSSGRMYNFRMVGRRSWILWSGTGQGHVVAAVDLSWTILYNPITGKRRALPAAPFMPFRGGVFSVLDEGEGAGCVVVNTCTKKRYFAFCRPGVDAGWKVFDRRKNMGSNAYDGRRFYANTACKATLAIDATTLAIEAVVPRPPGENFYTALGDYLVGSRGKLLRAIKYPCSATQAASTTDTDFYFNVYQLDVSAASGKAAWTKVDSIGNVVLFFDYYGHGFSLEPNDAAGLRRGCVYFMHEKKTWLETVWAARFLCRYNMEDGRVDNTVPLGNRLADTWLVPSLCHSDE